jgi:hypothetical protein
MYIQGERALSALSKKEEKLCTGPATSASKADEKMAGQSWQPHD